MAVTTLAAIMDTMITTVKALAPTFQSGVTFKPWDGLANNNPKVTFREWCEANPTASFRYFSIRRVGNVLPPTVTNTDLEEVESEVECVTAYPMDNRYGKDGGKDMDDVIEADNTKIEHAIGTNGYQTIETAGDACVMTQGSSIEVGSACAFGVLTMRVIWKRDM